MCGLFGLMVQIICNLFHSTVSQLLEQEILNNRKKLQMEALAAKQVRMLIKINLSLIIYSGLKRTNLFSTSKEAKIEHNVHFSTWVNVFNN